MKERCTPIERENNNLILLTKFRGESLKQDLEVVNCNFRVVGADYEFLVIANLET